MLGYDARTREIKTLLLLLTVTVADADVADVAGTSSACWAMMHGPVRSRHVAMAMCGTRLADLSRQANSSSWTLSAE